MDGRKNLTTPAPRLLPRGSVRKPSNVGLTGFLFVSGSVFHRVPLFKRSEPCEIFLRALDAYRRKFDFRVHAYVVMPEHYHFLVWFPHERRFTSFLRDFKSLVGKQVLDWMRLEQLSALMSRFRLESVPNRRRDPRFCVLQYGNVVKPFEGGARVLMQKVNYVHDNPVRAGLVSKAEEYPYSSMRDYLGEQSSLVQVDVLK